MSSDRCFTEYERRPTHTYHTVPKCFHLVHFCYVLGMRKNYCSKWECHRRPIHSCHVVPKVVHLVHTVPFVLIVFHCVGHKAWGCECILEDYLSQWYVTGGTMSLYVLVRGCEKGCVQDIEVPALSTQA